MLTPPYARLRLAAPVAILVTLALIAAACSGGASRPTAEAVAVGGDVTITADNLQFNVGTINAPADTEFTITFTNMESEPHNVAVYVAEAGEQVVIGEIITGPDVTTQVVVPALDAGTYYFRCDVHPEMEGELVVS
jgi:plastocyanin